MPTTFSERLQRRFALWWADRDLRARAHRLVEMMRQRSIDGPDEAWRCCAIWPRQLMAKHNGRVFAARHGCRVPTLYWQGRHVARIPWHDLPGSFVVKPSFGTAGGGAFILAGGRELMRDRPTTRALIRAAVQRRHGYWSRQPLLVEEFIVDADARGGVPTDYKVYMFGGHVGFVETIHRKSHEDLAIGAYDPEWRRLPAFRTLAVAETVPPPAHLGEMLARARALGAALETFMRVDFYMAKEGCVFGEFASTPGKGAYFSEHAERTLGALWDEHCPDRT